MDQIIQLWIRKIYQTVMRLASRIHIQEILHCRISYSIADTSFVIDADKDQAVSTELSQTILRIPGLVERLWRLAVIVSRAIE